MASGRKSGTSTGTEWMGFFFPSFAALQWNGDGRKNEKRRSLPCWLHGELLLLHLKKNFCTRFTFCCCVLVSPFQSYEGQIKCIHSIPYKLARS